MPPDQLLRLRDLLLRPDPDLSAQDRQHTQSLLDSFLNTYHGLLTGLGYEISDAHSFLLSDLRHNQGRLFTWLINTEQVIRTQLDETAVAPLTRPFLNELIEQQNKLLGPAPTSLSSATDVETLAHLISQREAFYHRLITNFRATQRAKLLSHTSPQILRQSPSSQIETASHLVNTELQPVLQAIFGSKAATRPLLTPPPRPPTSTTPSPTPSPSPPSPSVLKLFTPQLNNRLNLNPSDVETLAPRLNRYLEAGIVDPSSPEHVAYMVAYLNESRRLPPPPPSALEPLPLLTALQTSGQPDLLATLTPPPDSRPTPRLAQIQTLLPALPASLLSPVKLQTTLLNSTPATDLFLGPPLHPALSSADIDGLVDAIHLVRASSPFSFFTPPRKSPLAASVAGATSASLALALAQKDPSAARHSRLTLNYILLIRNGISWRAVNKHLTQLPPSQRPTDPIYQFVHRRPRLTARLNHETSVFTSLATQALTLGPSPTPKQILSLTPSLTAAPAINLIFRLEQKLASQHLFRDTFLTRLPFIRRLVASPLARHIRRRPINRFLSFIFHPLASVQGLIVSRRLRRLLPYFDPRGSQSPLHHRPVRDLLHHTLPGIQLYQNILRLPRFANFGTRLLFPRAFSPFRPLSPASLFLNTNRLLGRLIPLPSSLISSSKRRLARLFSSLGQLGLNQGVRGLSLASHTPSLISSISFASLPIFPTLALVGIIVFFYIPTINIAPLISTLVHLESSSGTLTVPPTTLAQSCLVFDDSWRSVPDHQAALTVANNLLVTKYPGLIDKACQGGTITMIYSPPNVTYCAWARTNYGELLWSNFNACYNGTEQYKFDYLLAHELTHFLQRYTNIYQDYHSITKGEALPLSNYPKDAVNNPGFHAVSEGIAEAFAIFVTCQEHNRHCNLYNSHPNFMELARIYTR